MGQKEINAVHKKLASIRIIQLLVYGRVLSCSCHGITAECYEKSESE